MAETAFADVQHVADRLGYELTEQQRIAAEYLLPAATGLIAVAAGKDDAWAATLDPVPSVTRYVCVEVVVRVLVNPEALDSVTEQAGDDRLSRSFRDGGYGTGVLALTPTEEGLVQRATGGLSSGSARLQSIVDDLYPEVPLLPLGEAE